MGIPLLKCTVSTWDKWALVRTHGLWPVALPLGGTDAGGPVARGLDLRGARRLQTSRLGASAREKGDERCCRTPSCLHRELATTSTRERHWRLALGLDC